MYASTQIAKLASWLEATTETDNKLSNAFYETDPSQLIRTDLIRPNFLNFMGFVHDGSLALGASVS